MNRDDMYDTARGLTTSAAWAFFCLMVAAGGMLVLAGRVEQPADHYAGGVTTTSVDWVEGFGRSQVEAKAQPVESITAWSEPVVTDPPQGDPTVGDTQPPSTPIVTSLSATVPPSASPTGAPATSARSTTAPPRPPTTQWTTTTPEQTTVPPATRPPTTTPEPTMPTTTEPEPEPTTEPEPEPTTEPEPEEALAASWSVGSRG